MAQYTQVLSYVRVSLCDQIAARQLEAFGDVYRFFVDAVSVSARDNRPAIEGSMGYVRDGDLVRESLIDRLTRSVGDLRSIIDEIHAKGASVEYVGVSQTRTPGPATPLKKLVLNYRLLAAKADW